MNYHVKYLDIGEAGDDFPSPLTHKTRKIVERESLGGFRIPEKNLKKHVNPSEYIYDRVNKTANNEFSFNPKAVKKHSREEEKLHVTSHDPSNRMLDSFVGTNYDLNLQPSTNLIGVIEREVARLKQEAKMKVEMIENSKFNEYEKEESIHEDKVYNELLGSNFNRIQEIKAVATTVKPEYSNLEDIRKEREKHTQAMLEIENAYLNRKNYSFTHTLNKKIESEYPNYPEQRPTVEQLEKMIKEANGY